jgi:DNA gyrase/topoisomerase IV subunit A
VREELEEIQASTATEDRSAAHAHRGTEDVEYTAESFIIEEDNVVIVSRDGWVKRQKEVKDLSTTRLREGDAVLAAVAGSTRATMVFFSNFGVAYTSRIVDVPASTGYGDPIQEAVQAEGRREDRCGVQPRSACREEDRSEEGRRCAAGARDRRHQRRLRYAFLAAAVRRGEHALGPPFRAHARERLKSSTSASRPVRKS